MGLLQDFRLRFYLFFSLLLEFLLEHKFVLSSRIVFEIFPRFPTGFSPKLPSGNPPELLGIPSENNPEIPRVSRGNTAGVLFEVPPGVTYANPPGVVSRSLPEVSSVNLQDFLLEII